MPPHLLETPDISIFMRSQGAASLHLSINGDVPVAVMELGNDSWVL